MSPRPPGSGGHPPSADKDPEHNDNSRRDDAPSDDDSDDDSSSSFSSVSGDDPPPIRLYGRTYHGSGRLYFPNDESEAKRLSTQHELYTACLDGRLHDAKLRIEDEAAQHTNGEDAGKDADDADDTRQQRFQILDVGAGSGVWSVAMARRYPNADVLGIDLSTSMLPKDVPPNLTFEVADVAEPWPPRTYDFIYVRNMADGGISDWERFVAEAVAHLRPGGVIEFAELRPRFLPLDVVGSASPRRYHTYGGVNGPRHRPAHDHLNSDPTSAATENATAWTEQLQETALLLKRMADEQGVDLDPVPRITTTLATQPVEGVRERVDWLRVKKPVEGAVVPRKEEVLHELVESGAFHSCFHRMPGHCTDISLGFVTWALMLFSKAGYDYEYTNSYLQRIIQDLFNPNVRSCLNMYGPAFPFRVSIANSLAELLLRQRNHFRGAKTTIRHTAGTTYTLHCRCWCRHRRGHLDWPILDYKNRR